MELEFVSAQEIIEVVLGPRMFEYREDLGMYYMIDHLNLIKLDLGFKKVYLCLLLD